MKPSRVDLGLLVADLKGSPEGDLSEALERAFDECVDGWAAVSGSRIGIDRIRILKLTRRCRVLRLENAGPLGRDVIAKRRIPAALQSERIVLQEIGPSTRVSMLELYGTIERSGFMWHFMEDGGSEHFDSADAEDRLSLASWICELHRHARRPISTDFPQHTTDVYRDHLVATYGRLDLGQGNPSVDEESRSGLSEVRSILEDVASAWSELVAFTSYLPDTLVHGDLQAKNILVRMRDGAPTVLPIDWETSGWGTPAADIALLARFDDGQAFLEHYEQSVLRHRFSRADSKRVVAAGHIFRSLAAMDWASYDQLNWGSARKPIKRLVEYGRGIRESMSNAGLMGRPV